MSADDVFPDAQTRITFLDTLADQDAPTTDELDDGIDLNSRITADGLVGFEAQTAGVDSTPYDARFDTSNVGRVSFSGTKLTIKKKSTSDTAYDTLVYAAEGWIVIRRYVPTETVWTAAQKVEVYPVQFGETVLLPSDKGRVERFEVPVFITDRPSLRAVVAAGA
jgi:hypothetical protein